MISNSQRNRRGLLRYCAAFVVMCTVTTLSSEPARGTPDNKTLRSPRREQVTNSMQRTRANVTPRYELARLQSARRTTRTTISNFDPRIDGFSFANWTESPTDTSIDIDVLVRVFGQSSVCARIIAGNCVPYRSASDFVTKLRVALANGRCDGLAVLASRLFQKQATIKDFSPNAKTVAELVQSQVDNEVIYWWATQILPTFSKASSETRTLLPSQFADLVEADIGSGTGSTIGMYTNGNGHSVLPIAIRFNGSLAEIDLYDGNTPGLTQTLVIDRDLESWVYVVRNSPELEYQTFSGKGSGGLALIPLDARIGAPTNYFAWLDGAQPAR